MFRNRKSYTMKYIRLIFEDYFHNDALYIKDL